MSKEQYLHLTLKPEGWAVVDMPENEPKSCQQLGKNCCRVGDQCLHVCGLFAHDMTGYKANIKSAIASATLIVPDQQDDFTRLIKHIDRLEPVSEIKLGEVYRVHFEGEIREVTKHWASCVSHMTPDVCTCDPKPETFLRLLPKESQTIEQYEQAGLEKYSKIESETVGEGDTAAQILEKHCPSMNDLFLDSQGKEFRDRVLKAMEEYKNKAK